MAYAAVVSLKHTINGLLNSSHSREILQSAYKETTSLQQVLERFINRSSSERLDDLEGQIRDCANQLEDVLESNEGDLDESIALFVEKVKEMEVEYIQELSKPADAAVSSNTDFGVGMVGHSHLFTSVRDHLLYKMRPDDLYFFSVLGELGTGRTLGVKKVFDDLQQNFSCCAWVTVGPNYKPEEVVIRILAQIDNLALDYELLSTWRRREDKYLSKYLHKVLERRRYMIVLDDVHEVSLLEFLRSSCPDQSNGSVVLLTTSSNEVAQHYDRYFRTGDCDGFVDELVFQLLCMEEMHTYDYIFPELAEAVKKIVENCRRLKIPYAKTLLFFYKSDRRDNTVEKWRKIAADKENPIFKVADEISERRKIKTEMQTYNWDNDDTYYKYICMLLKGSCDVIKETMFPERLFSKMQIFAMLGMAGIGKSTFARKILNDKLIMGHFDYRVWVTLGPEYQAEEILIDILAEVYPSIDKRRMKGDEEFARGLCERLSGKRCLIVLDDLWSREPLHNLRCVFPDIKGTTLVTTRLAELSKWGTGDLYIKLELLDVEESWCLLREKVFSEDQLCSSELEIAGRKIAEDCDGLPLLILTVAEQLLKIDITPENWNNVASGRDKSVFKNAHDQISKSLLPSYERLPQHLKPCFLYLGVFRIKNEISTSKLTNLWTAEGFLEPNQPQLIQDFVEECLSILADQSLIMVEKKISDLQIKTCRLHAVFWHLSNSVAVKNKFFHAMNSYADCLTESMKSQRRLCIRNSVLLGIKDVYDAMESSSSNARRVLLCTGPLHQYPVPLYFSSRLLRVLDALAIRFYTFPDEVVELIHLRYLGLTCNGKLPSSISKLWKLQHLIVSRYINTRSSENSSPLPVEIWDMKELNHLQVMGGCLPNPKHGDGLPKLSTLLDVSAESCTKKVLKRIPNLKRLGIRIELAPGDKGNPFRCLNRISRLRKLESLKCVVMNPQIGSDHVAPPSPISMFPSSLKKLSLSGFGYPWEYMSIIGKLENLEVLKLKRYAFQGTEWELDGISAFEKLKYLLVEETNLVRWEFKSCITIMLERLSIRYCYKLQQPPLSMPHLPMKIEIIDSNPSTVIWAEQRKRLNPLCEVKVHLSWIGKKDSQCNP